MNNRQSNRRRGRGNNRPQNNNNRGGGFDHQNTIDNRSRGNASQMLEKFKKQANDAQLNGDRVNAEHYLQVADHYFRVLADYRSRQEAKQERQERQEQRNDDNHSNKHNGDGEHQRNNQSRHQNDDSNDSDNSNDADQHNDEPAPRPRRAPKADSAKSEMVKKPRTPRKKPIAKDAPSDAPQNDSIDIAVLPPALSADEPAEEKPKKRAPRKKIVKKAEDNSEAIAAAE